MIFYIIGLLIIAYALFDLRKAFICFLVFNLFLVQNVAFVIPGMPLLTLDLFMTMALAALLLLKGNKIGVEREPFPYAKPMIFIAVSYLVSTVLSYVGFKQAISAYAKDMCSHYLIVWMIWSLITPKDIRPLFKWLAVAFLVTCLYGVYEHFAQTNPLADYELTLMADDSRAVDWHYDEDSYRGYRIKSVFDHAIGAGMNWALFITFVITMLYRYKLKVNASVRNLSIVAAALCLGCVFFTNSRAPIMFFFIAMFCWLDLKNRRLYFLLLAAVALFLVFSEYFSQYTDNVLSIINSQAQEKVGGSSVEMRLDQLDAAWTLLKTSPFFGLGYKFQNVMSSVLISRLLGSESMWFTILPSFGLFGIVANIYFFYYSVVVIPRRYKSKPVFFLSLAYWVVASLTSVPGYLFHLHYLVIILFVKLSPRYAKYQGGLGAEYR